MKGEGVPTLLSFKDFEQSRVNNQNSRSSRISAANPADNHRKTGFPFFAIIRGGYPSYRLLVLIYIYKNVESSSIYIKHKNN